ncbi:glucocorticoid-induced transcript 1 protein-like [Babylonia areolata]|uniref:glucocorticoid-induced transcript 1 protein-like n=1 Tax=Babylonia areolata TaxID=304850 RepID=UPI003FCF5B8E
MSQRMRPNVSPSTSKQGPLKAVRVFSLKDSSCATRSSNSSPTAREVRNNDKHSGSRKSPDHRSSPERRSPGSPSQKEKSSRAQHHSPVQYLTVLSAWRASSADPAVPYLTGQWPKDINSYHHYHSGGVFMCDKSTQTVENWEQVTEKKRSKVKGHRRSASFGQGDLSKEVIKQRLQKTKEGSRARWSPVTGSHSALSLTAPPTVFAQCLKGVVLPSTTSSLLHPPATRQNMNRFQRNSVEGLNVEIEKLVLSKPGSSSSAGQEPEEQEILRAQDIPDGHRAPIPEVTRLSSTRSVDTQTPSAQVEEAMPSAGGACRPESASPGAAVGGATAAAVATIVAPVPSHAMDLLQRPESRSDSLESKSSKGDSEYGSPEPSKFVSSPKLEKSCPFVRQPPDGCEKVKVIEDARRPSIKEPLLFCPVKPNQFVFKPSQGSAFCPLKHYLGEMGDLQSLRPASVPLVVTSTLNQSPTIEGQ